MKKLILVAAISTCASTTVLAKDMAIETNPLGLAIGFLNGTYLFDISDKLSVGPTFGFGGAGPTGDGVSLLSVSARAEYMPEGNDTSGLYVAGVANYTNFTSTSTDFDGTCEGALTSFGIIANGGYKLIAEGGFIAKIGARYSINTGGKLEFSCTGSDSYSESLPFATGGFGIEGSLGYKF